MGRSGGMRWVVLPRAAAAVLLGLAPGGVSTRILALEPVAIVAVTPGALDSNLACEVETRGLPDPPSRETLASGLPSAVVLALSVLDAAGRTLENARTEVRIQPDLWEQVFVVNMPDRDHRLASMQQIEAMLGHLPAIPALPLARLHRDAAYRIRVRLAVYALAPSEVQRSRRQFTGEGETPDADRREVAVGLDAILRFFLGKPASENWCAEATSRPFKRGDLPRFESRREPEESDSKTRCGDPPGRR